MSEIDVLDLVYDYLRNHGFDAHFGIDSLKTKIYFGRPSHCTVTVLHGEIILLGHYGPYYSSEIISCLSFYDPDCFENLITALNKAEDNYQKWLAPLRD